MAQADAAHEALDLVGREPRAALAAADAIVAAIRRPRTPDELEQVATAHRAAGLALRSIGEPAAGGMRLRRGISVAERGGLDEVAAEVRMSLAFVMLDLGRPRAALTTVDHALAALRGTRAARARAVRALVLQRSGRMREATDEYAAALTVLRRARDRDWEARLRHNRALMFIDLGETRSAIADLEWTRAYDLEAGHLIDAADALFNIGVALEAAGDIPGALATFDRAEQEWISVERPERWSARVDAYLRAGLVEEARSTARTAVEWLTRRDWPALEAQARLRLAQCLLSGTDPDPAEAAVHAARARQLFGAQGRHEGRDRADYLVLRCALALAPTTRDLDAVPDVCGRLRATGGDAESADLRTAAGEVALAQRDVRRARALLGPLAAAGGSSSFELRSRAALARAMLAEANDDARAARKDLAVAWSALERQRSLLGAVELRAASGSHAATVVARGTRLAVRAGSASAAFDWAERNRAASLRYAPAAPPANPDLARALARLRTSSLAESESLVEGEWSPALERERARHEREVVRLTRLRTGSGAPTDTVRVADVRRAVREDETFAQLLLDGAQVHAVVVSRNSTRLVELGPAGPLLSECAALTFCLRRLVTGFGGRARVDALVSSLEASAARLDLLVAGPLLDDRAGPLVLCLPAALTGAPWPALPRLRTRALTVAPSARTWVTARTSVPSGATGTLAVAGPGLPGARAEAQAVAALDPRAEALVGERATVAAVLLRLRDIRTLHVAAHGTLRQDNPLFSSLQLADGPLTGFDLDAAEVVPDTVVLSACGSAQAQDRGRQEPLGFAWTLMGRGARRVVAPLLPIPDELTVDLMVGLHRDLAAGVDAPHALAAARSRAAEDPGSVRSWVTASLVAYGD